MEWWWNSTQRNATEAVKESPLQSPVLTLPDPTRAFIVVCDTLGFAIDCELLQDDPDGHERVVAYVSRQLKDA